MNNQDGPPGPPQHHKIMTANQFMTIYKWAIEEGVTLIHIQLAQAETQSIRLREDALKRFDIPKAVFDGTLVRVTDPFNHTKMIIDPSYIVRISFE